MRKERIERVMKVIVPELMKEFHTDNYTRTPSINSGAYSEILLPGRQISFEERFIENLKKELSKNKDHYPLLERIVNAYNKSLLDR